MGAAAPSGRQLETRLSINLETVARVGNGALVTFLIAAAALGHFVSFYFHFLTVALFLLNLVNFYWIWVQRTHALLANYGFLAQGRYIMESIGPEFRQYWFSSDTEEKPFSRIERAEVYRKAKGVDSSAAFGSQLNFDDREIKLRHSFFPLAKGKLEPFALVFGEERDLKNTFTLDKPLLISAMSFGSLGANAVRALARGAKKANIPMNTGEGGFPKYHLMEEADLIFQMGTAKFGVRTGDARLDDDKLRTLSAHAQIRMIEIKFSQGAKPGKGGLLPGEKITEEIAELRGVPMGRDVISPPSHVECVDARSTVAFIRRVQEVAGIPTGIKFCLGRNAELGDLLSEMKRQDVFPDFITIDGAEGGTGAAPKAFMDSVGLPLFSGLPTVRMALEELGVRDRTKLLAAGKLINAGRQLTALALGASACYTARGFLFALGCIQALQCNQNTCPVGITTHDPHLQRGLDIELKSERVRNYALALAHDHEEMLAALGVSHPRQLTTEHLFLPSLTEHPWD